ncbi:hypothetical protein [Kosakonia sp. MUSA4]|uniref:hypothetical protein n=1 Tax=Kosakonia sp. MUSA4 TaxID=2067958 RepID=UPI00159793C1|nr:hypothetical protein [Kosakonia sp. MUSA4]QJT78714.1 hypothetical protein C0557_00755 [Kosakonia sp. MUSA4]
MAKLRKSNIPARDSLTHGYKFSSKHLTTWKTQSLPQGCRLIHAILFTESELYNKPAEKLFDTWDVISMSLVNIGEVKNQVNNMINKNKNTKGHSWELLGNGLYKFCSIGLVLDVPEQNILGTFDDDAWFPNRFDDRYGKGLARTSKLSSYIFSGEQFIEDTQKTGFIEGGFNQIKPAYELSRDIYKYNEVLAIGKPGINIYTGFPATRSIKVTAIYVGYEKMDFYDGKLQAVGSEADIIKRNLLRLRTANGFHLPVIDPTGSIIEMENCKL